MENHLPGVEIRNAAADPDFQSRPIRARNLQPERDAYLRMARLFLSGPHQILQELVDSSIALCGTEGAGISLLEGEEFRWVATGGKFAAFRDARLPASASPCGITLSRDQPQVFSVDVPYFNFIGVPPLPFTDGLLIPWRADDVNGTLWVVPAQDGPPLDIEDLRLLNSFANMAALAVRINGQQQRLHECDIMASGAQMANRLAHEINNPLQSLTNTLYLAAQTHPEPYLDMALIELKRLSGLVEQLLQVSRPG